MQFDRTFSRTLTYPLGAGKPVRLISKRLLIRWSFILGVWTLLGFTFASLIVITEMAMGHAFPVPLWPHMLWTIVQYQIWGAMIPGVSLLIRRYPLERQHWMRSLLIYSTAGLAFVVISTLIFVIIYNTFDGPWTEEVPPSWWLGFYFTLLIRLHLGLLIYALILLALYSLDYYRKYRAREFRLTQAELQVLKTQIQPHFLFNALNVISELVYESPAKADTVITHLSDLLRMSLDSSKTQEVRLREELRLIKKYMDINRVLLDDRLAVTYKIDPDSMDAYVPNMILQPLVENAIRHGIAPRASGGVVEVSTRKQGGLLTLEVRDDGMGIDDNSLSPLKVGIGLSNTQARLRHLYGSAQSFTLSESPEGGLTVTLVIPFREHRLESHDEDSYPGR